AGLDCDDELGEEPIVGAGGGGAERRAPYLAAGGPELGDALHRVGPGVEGDGSRDGAACGEPGRVRHHHGVARPRAPLEVGDDERLETGRVDDTPLLHVRLEAERMNEAAGGEETIGELAERQKGGTSHAGTPGPGDRPTGR